MPLPFYDKKLSNTDDLFAEQALKPFLRPIFCFCSISDMLYVNLQHKITHCRRYEKTNPPLLPDFAEKRIC